MNDITIQGIKLTKKDMSRLERQLGDGDWMVCTGDIADKCARDYILDSLWAFDASFLAGETGLPREAFACLSERLCEGASQAIAALIIATCGLDSFVRSAIDTDGHGHFLASYDGVEVEFRTSTNVIIY